MYRISIMFRISIHSYHSLILSFLKKKYSSFLIFLTPKSEYIE